uniref:Microfibril associated protein 4 n=1 Tax=Sander lucioperca TaxID=283035 RepID=A0A8C9YIB9_SANLU
MKTSVLFQLVSVFLVLLAPLLTSCQKLLLPVDCGDIYNDDNSRPSGVYTIYPIGATSAVQVYCDMVSEGGRWTVFQRRMDGTVNFYRGWDQYKTGFGIAAGEYWLGLESLYHLTLKKGTSCWSTWRTLKETKCLLVTPHSPSTLSPTDTDCLFLDSLMEEQVRFPH